MAGNSKEQKGSRKLSREERQQNQAVSMRESDSKKILKQIITIVRRHEVCRYPALRFLEANGWKEDSPVAAGGVVSLDTAARQKRSKDAKDKKELQKQKAAEAGPDVIGEQFEKLSDLKPAVLAERVFPMIHKSLLSFANIKALHPPKAKAATLYSDYAKLLEFLTGQPMELELKGGLSTWSGLGDFLKMNCVERGRLSSDTSLPINYGSHGVYVIHERFEDRAELSIKHRYSGARVVLKSDMLPEPPQCFDEVVIEGNHSESMASLRYVGASSRKIVSHRLAGHFITQASKKRPLALKDASSPGASSTSSKKSRKSSAGSQ